MGGFWNETQQDLNKMVDRVKFWGAKRSSRCWKWVAKPRRIPTDSQRGSAPPPPPPPIFHNFSCSVRIPYKVREWEHCLKMTIMGIPILSKSLYRSRAQDTTSFFRVSSSTDIWIDSLAVKLISSLTQLYWSQLIVSSPLLALLPAAY